MILSIVLLGYFMILLDTSIVITGLPATGSELGIDPVHLSWVQSSYTLVFGALLLLGARAGDIFGRKKVLYIGLALFAASSLAIALSPNAAVLIGARVVQGAGAAIIAPATLALITEFFPEGPARLRATSAYGAVAGIGVAAGLVIGGVFADLLSWRIGFFINVPIAAVLAYMVHKAIPATFSRPGSLDIFGAITSTAGIAAVLYAIVRSADYSWTDPFVLISLVLGIAVFIWFLRHESSAKEPLLPLGLFKNRRRNTILASRFLLVGSVMSFFFFATQLFQDTMGMNALRAGLAFIPLSLLQFASAAMVPRLSRAGVSDSMLTVIGFAIMVIGMAGLAFVPNTMIALILPIVLVGFGQGFAFGPMTALAVQGAPKDQSGAVSGLVNSLHQIGGTFGLGVFSSLAVAVIGHDATSEMISDRAHFGFLLSTVTLTLATIFAVTLLKRHETRKSSERPTQLVDEKAVTS